MANINTIDNQSQKPTLAAIANSMGLSQPDLLRHCPNCRNYHVVKNRGRDFCSDWCADTYYNRKRRYSKQFSEARINRLAIDEIHNGVPLIDPLPNQSLSLGKELYDKQIAINIEILDSLSIDLARGGEYSLLALQRMGFSIPAYTNRYKLHNTPAGTDAYCIAYSNYTLYSLRNDIVLIFKN